jgi:hypothetical protein
LSHTASENVIVHYVMSGQARLDTDYTLSGTPNQVTIPAGETSATVTLTATTAKKKGKERAIMTLTMGSGYQLPTRPGRKHKVRPRPPEAAVKINNK